jgi:hypothetical protein
MGGGWWEHVKRLNNVIKWWAIRSCKGAVQMFVGQMIIPSFREAANRRTKTEKEI